eukprot:14528926-Alexandrium_andersonii.AAC.1
MPVANAGHFSPWASPAAHWQEHLAKARFHRLRQLRRRTTHWPKLRRALQFRAEEAAASRSPRSRAPSSRAQ